MQIQSSVIAFHIVQTTQLCDIWLTFIDLHHYFLPHNVTLVIHT